MILTNTYFVGSPNQATLTIVDSAVPADPVSVATINDPSGIGYHPVNNSLIIARSDTTGNDKNFKRLDSNGNLSDWTTLTGLGFTDDMGNQGEIKLGIAQTTANGWTQGDLYFGAAQPRKIGKITANGSTVNTNWATRTNPTQMVGDTSPFIRGFYVDQTGVFGGDLSVVTGVGGVGMRLANLRAALYQREFVKAVPSLNPHPFRKGEGNLWWPETSAV